MFSSPAEKQKQTSYRLYIYSFSQKKGKLNFHLVNTFHCVTVLLLQHFQRSTIESKIEVAFVLTERRYLYVIPF